MAVESPGGADQAKSFPELHEEIARLPERYREPVVLCYLEGLTTEAAAQRLGWPRGTVLSRLSRARERLRGRLTRRGLAPSVGLLGAWPCPEAVTATMPAALLDATVRACLGFAERQAIATTLASAAAVALARGALHTMTISKLKTIGISALACVFALGGVQTFAYQFGGIGGGTQMPPGAASKPGDQRVALIRSVDKLQAQLDEANRRNAALQKDLLDIRAKVEALDANPPAVEEAKEEDKPRLQRYDNKLIIATSPLGDKITFLDLETKKAKSLKLSGSKASPLKVVPIVGPGAVALMLKGPKITRIAASDALTGVWHTQELREPVEGVANPIVGPGVVAYGLGRYVYAFSAKASRWSVVELPEGVQAIPIVGPGSVTIESGDHMYTLDVETGKWEHIDFRALLDAAVEAEDRDAELKK
jgi:hypothetical protein